MNHDYFYLQMNALMNQRKNVWIVDKEDNDSEILSYTTNKGEKAFFKIKQGYDSTNGFNLGLSCLPNDPLIKRTDEEKYGLGPNPEHIFCDGKSHSDNLKTVKGLVEYTVNYADYFGQGFGFETINKLLHENVLRDKVYKENDKLEHNWIVIDKSIDKSSHILPYTSANNEKTFFMIRYGDFGNGNIGLNFLSSNPLLMTEQERNALKPDHIVFDGHGSFDDHVNVAKNIVRDAVDTTKILEYSGQNVGFSDIKKYLHQSVIRNQIYKQNPDLAQNAEYIEFKQKQEEQEHKQNKPAPQPGIKSSEIEAAKKAGYVQGVCECVAAVGNDYTLGKKLLAEMNVTKKLAKEYASPETFKALESGVFAQKQEQKLEHQQKRGHRR